MGSARRQRACPLRAQLEFGGEARKGVGRFHGIQIFPLDVLNQGDFEQALIGNFAHDNGNVADFGQFCGAPSPFSGHQLVAVAHTPDNQGLHDSVGTDGLCQFRHALVLEEAARLKGIWIDCIHRERLHGIVRRRWRRCGWWSGGGASWQQRAKALTECLARIVDFVHGPEFLSPV